MHRLGVTAPSHDSVRINSVLALKMMLMPVRGGYKSTRAHCISSHRTKKVFQKSS